MNAAVVPWPGTPERASQRSFESFFLGGFECSAHRRRDRQRLDLLESTQHARLAEKDYAHLSALGIRTVRDGVRWHLTDRSGYYDWSSWLPMLKAAARTGTQVIWDLCHYGWPDDLDIWSAAFVDRMARHAAAVARLSLDETGVSGLYCPVNEMSFWAWAGADMATINPCERGRGAELKRQLVRAYLASVAAIREIDPFARFMLSEPSIHIVCEARQAHVREEAERYRCAQFEVHDMITGALEPQLGGAPACLDLVGMNFYPHNQWYWRGNTIPLGHHAHRPFRAMLAEVHQRFARPIVISETGAEGSARPYWLHHVCAETLAARAEGVAIEGLCLYPILDYAGWENDRLCPVGLLSMPDMKGERRVHEPMLAELRRQQTLFAQAERMRETAALG